MEKLQKYETLELEVLVFESEDIVTDSCPTDFCPTDGGLQGN